MIRSSGRSGVQPRTFAQANRSHRSYARLCALGNAAAPDVDWQSFYRTARQSGFSRVVGARGVAVQNTGAASDCLKYAVSPIASSNGAGTGEYTMMVCAAPPNEASAKWMMGSRKGVANYNIATIEANGVNTVAAAGRIGCTLYDITNISQLQTSGASYTDGTPHVYAVTRTGTTVTIYFDGVSVYSNTASANGATMWASNDPLWIGSIGSGGNGATNIPIFGWAGWNRALSAAEIAAIGRDFWQLFSRPRRAQVVAPAAAMSAAAAMAESISLADTPTVTMSVTAAIAEALGLADTSSVVMSATADVSESTSLVDTVSGAVGTLSAAMSESISLADTASSVMTATAAIAESLTLTDTPSVVLTASRAVAESIALADTVAGGTALTASVVEALSLAELVGAVVGSVVYARGRPITGRAFDLRTITESRPVSVETRRRPQQRE